MIQKPILVCNRRHQGAEDRSLDNWAKHDHYEAALQVAKSAFRSIIQKRKEEQPENNSKVRSKPPKRPTFNRPFVRVGETYRQSNISTEEFLSTFKFRGIEWEIM